VKRELTARLLEALPSPTTPTAGSRPAPRAQRSRTTDMARRPPGLNGRIEELERGPSAKMDTGMERGTKEQAAEGAEASRSDRAGRCSQEDSIVAPTRTPAIEDTTR